MQATENTFQSEYNFLLNSYSGSEVEAVISDLERSSGGCHLLYIIDTYDILENYLPYTQAELFSKRDINFYAQKFICYDYFFGQFNSTNTILLDEYKVELLAAKNKLNRHLREARAVLQNLEKLKKETNDFFTNTEKTEEFFNKHFEVILLLLILNDKSNSILDEFFFFLKNRLHITEVIGRDGKDTDMLAGIFAGCRHSKFAITLFSGFIEENKASLLTAKDYDERHIYLENTLRDAQVIERIWKINEAFEKRGMNYYAIYLSSAKKTGELLKVLNTLKRKVGEDTGDIGFHRNIYQYFLYDRIRSEYKEDTRAGRSVLESLRELIVKINTGNVGEPSSPSGEKETAEVLGIVKKLFNEKSNIIDNHFYLSVYEKYKKTFDNLNESDAKKLIDKNEIIKIIREVDKNKKIYNNKVFNLGFNLSQLNQTYDMVETIAKLDDFEPEYRYGSDIIRNPYQHLPLLLLVHYKTHPVLRQALYTFLNCTIEINFERSKLKTQARNLLAEIARLPLSEPATKLMRSLLITYLNFVAQTKDKSLTAKEQETNTRQLETITIEDLEKQYEITRYQFQKLDFEKTAEAGKVEFKQDNQELLTEIVYLLIWLYRRNGRELEGIELGRILLKEEKDDPRILQGLALCYISHVYNLLKKRGHTGTAKLEIEKNTDLAFLFLKAAGEKYRTMINEHGEADSSMLLIKNYIAVLNSLADMSLRKYELEIGRDISLIEMARLHIDEIKELFNAAKLLYNNYPTYSATELEIEYYEAQHYYSVGEIGKAHQKVLNAMSRAEILRKIPDSAKYVDEIFLQKIKNLNELATNIFKQLK